MKNILICFLFLIAMIFLSCDDNTDEKKDIIHTITSLNITNLSSYILYDVKYSSIGFGNIAVGDTKSKELNPNNTSIPVFFTLMVNGNPVHCRTNDIKSITEGVKDDWVIYNTNSITTITGGINGTLSFVYNALSKPILELNQNNLIISNNNPLPFDFEDVEITKNKQYIFTIKNIGNLPLELNGTPILLSSNEVFKIPSQPTTTTINPGALLAFLILYTPIEEGEDTGAITIFNNSDELVFTLNIKGKGYIKKPQINIKQDSSIINIYGEYNFNKVAIGDYIDTTFIIENTGAADLSIVNVNENRINVENNNGNNFSVIQPAASIIIPNNQTTFVVRFTPPIEENNLTATIKIKTNSSSNDEFSFIVRGNGYIKKPQVQLKQNNTVISQNGEFYLGSVLNGKSEDIIFTIENIGEADLNFITINNNSINFGDNISGYYSVIQQPFSATIVNSESSTTFIIRFNPTVIGINYTASIHINTNSQYDADFSFWIKGDSRDYIIGDIGPGGGLVFYAQGGQYKECSAELGSHNWETAMTVASSYNGGGFTDWYLPSLGEFQLMYDNLHKRNLGGFYYNYTFDSYYWSSTSDIRFKDCYYIFVFRTTTSSYDIDSSVSIGRVRAVRTFTMN